MQDLLSISQICSILTISTNRLVYVINHSCLNYDDNSHIVVLLAFTLSYLSFTLRTVYFQKCKSDYAIASASNTSITSRCFETKGKMPQQSLPGLDSSTSLSSLNFYFFSHLLFQPHRPSLCPCSHHVLPFCCNGLSHVIPCAWNAV